MTQTVLITMVGQIPTPPYQLVTWNVYNEPDNTGAQSGYGAGFLINVGVDSVTVLGNQVDPISLQVGGDLTGSLPNPSVSGLQGNPIAATAPTLNQALIWNGTAWAPTSVAFPSDEVGGDLSGTLPNPTVVGLQGVAIEATSPSDNQYLAYGSGGGAWRPVTISLGGDVSGGLNNTSVDKLKGTAVSASAPSNGQFLVYNGTSWTPTTVSIPSSSVGGDLDGTLPNPTVVGLQGVTLDGTPPSDNQYLAYSSGGNAWRPVTISLQGDVSGGLNTTSVDKLKGTSVSASAPTSGQYLIYNGSAWTPTTVTLAGDVSGSPGANTVDKIDGSPVEIATPTTGQLLVYNGTRWVNTTPAIPLTTSAVSTATPSTIALRDSDGKFQLSSDTGTTSTTYGGSIIAGITTSFSLSQSARATDAATNDLTFAPQAPFASATGSNRLPGDFTINFPDATGGLDTSGNFLISFNGAAGIQMYEVPSSSLGVIEFPNDGSINNILSLQSQSSMSLFAATLCDIYGTPIHLTSTGEITFTADDVINIQGNGVGIYDTGGLVGITIDSGAADTTLTYNNLGLGGTISAGDGFGVIFIANRSAAPTTNPTGGGILYAEAGALKWRGSSGTVTTIANA